MRLNVAKKETSASVAKLAFLADVLYSNHGLTLQPQKTTVLTSEHFRERFASPEESEVNSLYSKFQELINQLGLANWYEPINYEDLDDKQKKSCWIL